MSDKIRVGILFGGRSAEHEISLHSAKNIIDAIDKQKYDPVLIGINKQGQWHLSQAAEHLIHADNPKLAHLKQSEHTITFTPGHPTRALSVLQNPNTLQAIDVIFPMLHGPLGEDGTMQGLLRLADIPFVGCDVLSSAVCMDKDITKRLLLQAGLPTCSYISCEQHARHTLDFNTLSETLGLPLFVKPANMGSSIGISKVSDEKAFVHAVDHAFEFDTKIIIEACIRGRELEIAILGNEVPEASIVGEIIPKTEFYSYEAKYIDEEGATLCVPADIPENIQAELRTMACKAFTVLGCRGLARCDFFLNEAGELFINEINTMPGFTQISMYPKLWAASGVAYPALIDKLITLAMAWHKQSTQLKTTM